MECNAQLNVRQKKIMTYLLSCRTVKEVAQKAGVRLATVFKWLKDPEFKAELDRLREELYGAAFLHDALNESKYFN